MPVRVTWYCLFNFSQTVRYGVINNERMKDKILELRCQGKSYNEIALILNCSKSTVSYYCGKGQKEKSKERVSKKRSLDHPASRKVENFIGRKKVKNATEKFQMRDGSGRLDSMKDAKIVFKVSDVLDKFGENPKCYLTGRPIDWNDPKSYSFDHVVAASRGGSNSLENLQLVCPEVNCAKSDLSVEEFIGFCKEVLEYNGYFVTLPNS